MAMGIEIGKLRLFIDVLDAGSITGGATRSHLSVAAASSRIQELESAIGVRVFERTRKGVIPTAAGHQLAEYARTVLVDISRLRDGMRPYAQGIRGRVKLLANTAALTGFLPKPLAEFLSARPDIDMDLEERWSGEIIEALHRKQADLGVFADTVATVGLQTVPLASDSLVLVGSPAVIVPLGDSPLFADCLELPMVGLSQESALYTYLQSKAASQGRSIHYRVRMRTFDGVLRMVSLNVGVSIVSSLATAEIASSYPQLVWRPLSDPWAKRTLVLCTHYQSEIPNYVKDLMDCLSAKS